MSERKSSDIRRAIDAELSAVGRDPFLYQRVLNQAAEAPERRRRPRRLTAALILVAVVMLTTAVAVATNWLGVKYFLTERNSVPVEVQEAYIVHPTQQSFDSERMDLQVGDAYWYADPFGDRLSLTLHADVKDSAKPFCIEIDIGTDGESFDMIWWQGEIIPVAQWLAGRDGYVMDISVKSSLGGRDYLQSVDYVHEEQGVTLLLEMRNIPDLSEGAELTLMVSSNPIYPSAEDDDGYRIDWEDREEVTLTVTLPPMTKGPAKEIDWANEPNA